MDSHKFFAYGITEADLSFPKISSSAPSALFDSLKFDSRTSPNSPFASYFDPQTPTTENISGASPSSNSSLDYNSYPQRCSPTVGEYTFLQNGNHNQKMKHVLWQLESSLMGPDQSSGENTQKQTSSQGSWSQEAEASGQFESSRQFVKSDEGVQSEKRHKTMLDFPPVNIKQLLIECARKLDENKLVEFDRLIDRARGAVSITGDPIQRLGAYMVEGLVARKEASGTNIYRTLKCKEPMGNDLLSYMHILYEICPYLKFGYMAANGAIAEAFKKEDRIHIIDFQIAQGTQWMTLLQALAARPGGAPYVRITGIDDPLSKHARGGDGLALVGKRLAAISEKFNIRVEFNPVPVFAPRVTREMLDVTPGEALAVNFPLQLHHTPDESVDVSNPRDGLLRMVKSLSPKVVTLVEQESNTNTAPFFTRFVEALEYYSAMFESLDVALPRDRKERINVEQHCLARDIVNVIACEGKDRVERHELLGKWKSRFTMAGFRQYPLSSYVNSVINGLLKCYSEHYTLVEKDGAMLLGWKERSLISASAWH